MAIQTEAPKVKRPAEREYRRHEHKCIRCWDRRPQKSHWCLECWNEMHRLARQNGNDPHTCQNIDIDGNRCPCLTQPGEPFCPDCADFLTGKVSCG